MLKLKNVSKYYTKNSIVAKGIENVNLELYLGEFVVITGESGSGKSTLLNVLSGLDSYEDGEMYINGKETSHYTENDYLNYRQKYISNIFQNFNLINSYTVYQNIELVLLLNGYNKKKIKKHINELIKKVGLTKYKKTFVSKLSGGQKQRVAIARALASDTPIMVADEPTGALDSKSSKEIIKLLADISKDKLVIVVTHNKEEIKNYATRLIKMHDGKIQEDVIIKKVNNDDKIQESQVKSINFLNKIRLGIRNAFNIPIKFILMLSIFLLIIYTLFFNFSSFKSSEIEQKIDNTNILFFQNTNNKRIIISKKSKDIINDFDYNNINNLDNIDYIFRNDILLDKSLYLVNDQDFLEGNLDFLNTKKVDKGRLPLNKNEMVIMGNSNDWYLTDEIINQELYLDKTNIHFKVVGILFSKDMIEDTYKFIFNENGLKDIESYINTMYVDLAFKLDNKYISDNYSIVPNKNIKPNEVYIDSKNNYRCQYYNCLNKNLQIDLHNIYFDNSYNFKITNTFNSNNSKKLLNLEYSNFEDIIFVSEEDFYNMFGKGYYQSSVFVKELKNIDNTVKELNNLGFNTIKIKDIKSRDYNMFFPILKILKTIITSILIFTMFFISYFIIKIIYKSRNSYYNTLRTLGASKKNCVWILLYEIITFSNIAYLIYLVGERLIKLNIIKNNYLKNIINYIDLKDYLLIYFILIILSILISIRYGRKIFKQSIIKTYGE